MSFKNNKPFNKEYYLQISFQANIHRGGEAQAKQTEKLICLVSSIPANCCLSQIAK